MKKFILLIVCSWAISLTYAISVSQSNSQTVIDTVIVEMPEHCIVVTDQQNGWQFYQETDSFLVATGFYASSIQSNGDYASSDGDIITDATILYSKNAGGEMTQVQLTDVSCSVRPNDTKDTIRFTTWMITDVGRMYEIHMAYYKPIPKDTVDITIDNCKFADGREINDAWSMYETSEDGKYFLMISPRGDSLEGRWEKDFMFMGDDFCENYQSFYIISNGLQKGIYLMDGWFESHIENYNLVAEAEFLCSDDICYRFHLSAYIAPVVSVHIGVDALCEDMGYVQYEDIVYHKGDTITIFAEANLSYHFTQWSDGNTENPRAIVLTQDTVINALFALDYSGTCGDALYWIYNDSCLTITGTGTMYDYTFSNVPWQLLRDGISSLFIGEQVESIGENAFINCYKLDDVSIPNSVTSIGYKAFCSCSSLTSITLPNSVTSIGEYAFCYCSSLTSVTSLSCTPPSCGSNVFNYTPSEKTLVVPSISMDAYKNSSTWKDFTSFEKCLSVFVQSSDSTLGVAQIDQEVDCDSVAIISAVGAFIQWSDGNTDNPRTIKLTQDTTLTAEFGLAYSGKCGDDLYWAYSNQEIKIIGTGAMYNYTDSTMPWTLLRDSILTVRVGNNATSIGEYAFANTRKLAELQIGTGVEDIGANAFAGCNRIYHIYCYPTYPPFADESSFANYNVYLHIPCENKEGYTLDLAWGKFKFIECIGSEDVEVSGNEVTISPDYEDATFTWPVTDNADTYSLVITKDGVTFCTLVFNAQGQLVSIAFKPRRQNAPAAEGTTPATYAEMTANGFRFTVTGLDEGSAYAYTLTVRNAANTVLETYTGDFTTLSNTPTGINESAGEDAHGQVEKIIRDGQVLILRNGVAYDMMGQTL